MDFCYRGLAMNKNSIFIAAAFGLCALAQAEVIKSADFYVDAVNGSDDADGTSWATARQSIQSAINSATTGCTILVADGLYEPIVCTNKVLSIWSVHGPFSTTIDAQGAARRCADLGNGVTLVGFTLQNGKFPTGGWDGGGGARGGILRNCIVRNNSGRDGGGIQDSECHNCLIYGNNALNGGGSGGGPLYNCTIVGNSARNNGGGIAGGDCYNCIITGNSAYNSAYSSTANTAEKYCARIPFLPNWRGRIFCRCGKP